MQFFGKDKYLIRFELNLRLKVVDVAIHSLSFLL
jgi:hypothetical protein